MRLNLYSQQNEQGQVILAGDLVLSVNEVPDKKFFDMGWCFRPYVPTSTVNHRYDCLDVRFYFSNNEIDDERKPGYSNKYIGYDLFAPDLDEKRMLPIDLVLQSLDDNIDRLAIN